MHRPLLIRRLGRRRLIALDVLAALLLSGAAAGNLAGGAWTPTGVPSWLNWFSAIAIGMPVAIRRIRPRFAFGAVVVLSILGAVGGGAWVTYFAIALPLHMVARDESRRRSVPALGLVLAYSVAVNLAPPSNTSIGGIALGWAVLSAAWVIGRTTRERRQHAALAAEQRAREAVLAERLRIARELHDIVAHSLSLVTTSARYIPIPEHRSRLVCP